MTATTVDTSQAEFRCRDVGVRLGGAKGSREVLTGVNLDVAVGSVTTVVGRSGVGKTTLLRLFAGLTTSTCGSFEHRGKQVAGPLPGVVTVFQDYTNALLPWRTVERNVSLGLETERMDRAARRSRVRETLEIVGLHDYANEYPWRLSGGMQQRVQIARALAVKPRVLLMDEPFGALDNMTKALLQDQLLAVRSATGCTVVFITHDVEEAVYLGDQIVVMTGKPGTVSTSVPVGLSAPRDQLTTREQPRFLEIRHQVYGQLGFSGDE